MKSPVSVLNFTHQSWLSTAIQVQRLQFDLATVLNLFDLISNNQYEIYLDSTHLTIKSNAAFLTRLRQIKPELLNELATKGWRIENLTLLVVKHADALNTHIKRTTWISPNELRYGKKCIPTQEQRNLIFSSRQVSDKLS